ncbi:hypothetical protein [Paenibacillus sp. Soil522]|uniref:hypothetical protein n=1 Tax=Paenibacillus sp. Soil522 TaxID=1736388 RepID=UPI000B13ECB7|nr:hypothetical protein [Paenibacillus sp. Soil522]
MDNAHVYKIINDHHKVEVRPEELYPGTKIELWVSSFGQADINEMFIYAMEVNILP